ncbi:hypothetical protein Q4566_06435 [Tamlana sp. 2_MG-2023]|uniref:hypothetical protein n=1 Tax=unclassified Tamlana TaxID=2614803 RepID=UPI0026E34548|nr:MULTISPECIES: hypothetical protein [unclassified Tamlana]MDO6759834.1 hypothetical protein [Tamlana sp. 2_MG-2023]MDO6791457.1 hypothetical protein [Tamlana sp. 1_MG-2023]
MNNIFTNTRKGFLMVTLFATMLSFANENDFYNINVEASKTTLTLNYAKEGSALSIKDLNGSVLYSETIKATGRYKREFDLSFLPNGDYKFEVDKDLQIKEIPFTLNSGVVTFNKNEEKLIYKPFIRVSGDLVYISKLALDGEDLKVDIYFTKNNNRSHSELVISENIKGDATIEKVYRLEDLNQGKYQVILHAADRRFEKNI